MLAAILRLAGAVHQVAEAIGVDLDVRRRCE